MAEDTSQQQRARIDWSATLAGAGAAVTVAVLLSTLGAAGTLIGAALGSMVATVSTALYKQGIETSRRRVAAVQAAALHKINQADQDVRRAGLGADPIARADLARARRRLDAAGSALEGAADAEPEPRSDAVPLPVAPVPVEGSVPEESRWKALPWRRIAVLTVAVFVVTLGVISAVELIAGRSVSSITGGTDGTDRTSLSGVLDGNGDGDRKQRDRPTDPATDPSDPSDRSDPSDTGATDPTEDPSGSDTPPTDGAPSPEPSATVTVTETATVPETTAGTPSEVPAP